MAQRRTEIPPTRAVPALPIRPNMNSSSPRPHTTPSTNSATSTDHVCDVIYENQRGTAFFNKLKFSRRFLLPTDYRPFSKDNGEFVVEKEFFQCPPTWEWISDWIVDMSGDVDPEGWAYASHFGSDKWSGIPNMIHYVRRKKWIRMRRQCPVVQTKDTGYTTGPKHSVTTLHQQSILKALQAVGNDRMKLVVLNQYLTEKSEKIDREVVVSQILDQFEFESGKLKAARLLFAPIMISTPNQTALLIDGTRSTDKLKDTGSSTPKFQNSEESDKVMSSLPPPLPKPSKESVRDSFARTICSKLIYTGDKLTFMRDAGLTDENIERILYLK